MLTGFFSADGQVRVRGVATDEQSRNLVANQRESQASYSSFGQASQVITNHETVWRNHNFKFISVLQVFSSPVPWSSLTKSIEGPGG